MDAYDRFCSWDAAAEVIEADDDAYREGRDERAEAAASAYELRTPADTGGDDAQERAA